MRRKTTLLIAAPVLVAIAGLSGGLPAAAGGAAPTLEFVDGQWFDGRGFVARSRYYSDGGVLTETAPARIDRVIDLGDGFVIPALADAHHHAVHPGDINAQNTGFLGEGVFWVMNPATLPREDDEIRAKLARSTTIDALFAGGVITARGGHPIQLAERNIAAGTWSLADGERGFYWVADDSADLDVWWDSFLADPRDFVKTFLLYSEEFEQRRDDPAYYGERGVDPALIPEIVERSHAAGLRAVVHVETVSDFRVAVKAGADIIAHMPGFRPDGEIILSEGFGRYRLKGSDARAAARAGVAVVTTLGSLVESIEEIELDPEIAAYGVQGRKVTRKNLKLLRKRGVPLLIGGDRGEHSTWEEVDALRRLGGFTNLELLKMWCENTPRALYPDRQIGSLDAGSETQLLVLGGDPLEDLGALRNIVRMFKDGREIAVE